MQRATGLWMVGQTRMTELRNNAVSAARGPETARKCADGTGRCRSHHRSSVVAFLLGRRPTCSVHRRARPVFLAGVFTDFFEVFLAAVFFAGDSWAAIFLAAFFAGVFLAVCCAAAFFATFLAPFLGGVFFTVFVTVVKAAPTAVLTELATSSAIASPYPTVSAAFSTIVFSAILRPHSLEFHVSLRIVEAYLPEHASHLRPRPFRMRPLLVAAILSE